VATYAIIVMLENEIVKSYSKKSRIEIKNSTEIEVFAVYQAMNLILSCFIKKNEEQVFCIHTDCSQVPIFFENKNKKMKIFKEDEKIKKEMLSTYQTICAKLRKNNCDFSLQWIARDLNKIAHEHTYHMLNRVRNAKNLKEMKEDILISKKTFCELLSNFNKRQMAIIIYLLNSSSQDGIIEITQKQLAENMNVPISTISKVMRELGQFQILEKVKNGKYLLLI